MSLATVTEEMEVVRVYSTQSEMQARAGEEGRCAFIEEGCEVILVHPLLRADPDNATWIAGREPLLLRVRADVYASGDPLIFVAFWTEDEPPQVWLGYIGLPAACVTLCCGTICALSARTLWLRCCPDDRDALRRRAQCRRRLRARTVHAAWTPVPLSETAELESASASAWPWGWGEDGPTPTLARPTLESARNVLDLRGGTRRSFPLIRDTDHVFMIDLSDNLLTSLVGVHDLSRLLVADLGNNRLRDEALPPLRSCPHLGTLDLSTNDLSRPDLGECAALRYLNLDFNEVVAFRAPPQLRQLSVSHNNLEELDLRGLHELEEAHADDNAIHTLRMEVRGDSPLHTLRLRANSFHERIEAFDAGVRLLIAHTKLRLLDVRNCGIPPHIRSEWVASGRGASGCLVRPLPDETDPPIRGAEEEVREARQAWVHSVGTH